QHLAVGEIAVAAAVLPAQGRADPLNLEKRADRPGLAERLPDKSAFGVEIGADMMRHLQGEVAQADAAIIAGGREPQRAVVKDLVADAPEPDVVAMRGGNAVGQLERQILDASVIKQRTDRRRRIGAV